MILLWSARRAPFPFPPAYIPSATHRLPSLSEIPFRNFPEFLHLSSKRARAALIVSRSGISLFLPLLSSKINSNGDRKRGVIEFLRSPNDTNRSACSVVARVSLKRRRARRHGHEKAASSSSRYEINSGHLSHTLSRAPARALQLQLYFSKLPASISSAESRPGSQTRGREYLLRCLIVAWEKRAAAREGILHCAGRFFSPPDGILLFFDFLQRFLLAFFFCLSHPLAFHSRRRSFHCFRRSRALSLVVRERRDRRTTCIRWSAVSRTLIVQSKVVQGGRDGIRKKKFARAPAKRKARLKLIAQ